MTQRELPPTVTTNQPPTIVSLITRCLAGYIISNPDFPKQEHLPYVTPPAFLTFGHQVLIDYQYIVRVVWQVTEEIRSTARELQSFHQYWKMALLIIATIMLSCACLMGISSMPIIILLIILIITLSIYIRKKEHDVKLKVAKIRIDSLRKVLDGTFCLTEGFRNIQVQQFGDGALGNGYIPVVTFFDDAQPFCGYGRLQLDTLFVCRPKDAPKSTMLDLEKARKLIIEKMIRKSSELCQTETATLSFGDVIVLHGDSISIDSRWLTADKRPILWLPMVFQASAIDPRASVRVYFALQIVFPKHLTAATLFFRLFQAGNAVAFQVAITTLGPPRVTMEALIERLMQYNLEYEYKTSKNARSSLQVDRNSSAKYIHQLTQPERNEILALGHARKMIEKKPAVQLDLNLSDIMDLEFQDDVKHSEYYARLNDVASKTTIWPGRYMHAIYPNANWREANSVTFPSDFFGRPECLASIRVLYDQIARVILDDLDEEGFDISDYRNSQGVYSINADKIDQLIVGESIIIDNAKKVAGRNNEPEGAPKQSVTIPQTHD